MPFDAWESSQITVSIRAWTLFQRCLTKGWLKQFKLYYQTGLGDLQAQLSETGEPLLPAVQNMLEIYDPKPLTAAEVLKVSSL